MEAKTRTTEFAGAHVSVASEKAYEEVVGALESAVVEYDFGRYAELVGTTGTWEEFDRKISGIVGESGFMAFWVIDHGGWMARVPHPVKSKMWVIGNPQIARHMMEHRPEVGLYVPVRIHVYEDVEGTVRVDYHRVSPVLERFGSQEGDEVARSLDQKLAALAATAAAA